MGRHTSSLQSPRENDITSLYTSSIDGLYIDVVQKEAIGTVSLSHSSSRVQVASQNLLKADRTAAAVKWGQIEFRSVRPVGKTPYAPWIICSPKQ